MPRTHRSAAAALDGARENWPLHPINAEPSRAMDPRHKAWEGGLLDFEFYFFAGAAGWLAAGAASVWPLIGGVFGGRRVRVWIG